VRQIAPFPDPFITNAGPRVRSGEEWFARREEIIDLLLSTQYGTMPDAPDRVEATSGQWKALTDGRKRRTDHLEFTPYVEKPRLSFTLDITLTHPSDDDLARKRQAVPGFGDQGLPVLIYVGGKTHDCLLANGYVVVNYPNDSLEPMEMGKPKLGPARETYQSLYRDKFSWGSISAWAWGARRVLDHILRLPEIDPSKTIISGHSRNGKTALLAGALDERFAVVNPAGSGCAGAGSYLALGDDCEDLAALTSRDRWWAWAHPDFESWVGREPELPFDQHFLMSLVAPRPLLRTEGVDDHWANPAGTSATYLATQPVYDLLGVPDRNTIYYRDGGHDHTEEDAAALVTLCDETFYDQPRSQNLSEPLPGTPKLEDLADWSNEL
jgi:hypothetical protein